MTVAEMIPYMIAQVVGGTLGGFLGGTVSGSFATVTMGANATLVQALLAEVFVTFALCFVVLSVATNPKVDGNHYYGLAIGLVVLSGAIGVGGISGGAFNPAVALGLSFAGALSNLPYGVMVSSANLVGGAIAAVCYLACNTEPSGTSGETTSLIA